MKIAVVVALLSFAEPSRAAGFRSLVSRRAARRESDAAPADPADGGVESGEADEEGRRLNNCWTNNNVAEWHPKYSEGWAGGYCSFTVDCDSPGYSSQLACCKGAYPDQTSGKCLSMLPSPPTTSPTDTGGLDVYYPDYGTAWPDAGCINTRPMPSGRPTYSTMLACCKGAYGGQMSGKCLSMLPSPPTTSPTGPGGVADFWYPDYDTAWSEAGCKNDLPLPFNNPNDRPNYSTMLACCKGAYGGQTSGKCLSMLPSPPTTSPTGAGGLDVWYPDYDTAWPDAGCINEGPMPSGRPTYSTMLACCKGAYGGQTSGKCLSMLPTPPTTSPTATGGLDVYYPDYGTAWSDAGCINTRPLPSGRPTYTTMLACCKGAYGGQTSGKCLSMLPSPPTTSPTATGGLDVWYPDYGTAWSDAGCINDRPMPSGRPSYATRSSCCSGAYGSQMSNTCMCQVDACYSCKCPGAATNTNCNLVCS